MTPHTMDLEVVQDMVNNYKTKQYVSIVTNKTNPMAFDAQSVNFDLHSLKRYIDAIEHEVALHPEFDLQNLGIRFYYSAYPSTSWEDNPDLADVSADYKKLHTLIAIPTAVVNGVRTDFNPLDVRTYDGAKPTDGSMLILAENHGRLTPPNSDVNLWF